MSMDTHPTAPSLATFGAAAASTAAPPKPVAVLLLQILCGIAIALELGVTVMSFWRFPVGSGMLLVRLFSLAFNAALIVWLGSALFGAQRGESYGRLLGLSVLVVLTLIGVTNVLGGLTNDGTPGVSEAYRMGRLAGSGLGLALMAWWIRAYGFSATARAWFDQSRGVEVHLHGWDA